MTLTRKLWRRFTGTASGNFRVNLKLNSTFSGSDSAESRARAARPGLGPGDDSAPGPGPESPRPSLPVSLSLPVAVLNPALRLLSGPAGAAPSPTRSPSL